eukprot:scaffold7617_cov143-Cylindrotheca_fusiformis.AAC.1
MISAGGGSNLCQPMVNYLRGRLKMEDALGRSYFQPDLSFCTNDFVRRALTPDVWDVGPTRSIPMAAQGQSFTPLAFNVALNPEYPIATLPPDGYPVTEAVRLGVLLYEFYASLDRKVLHGRIDTSSFQASFFGGILKEWARLPGFPAINEVWQRHQRSCSAWWMAHLMELFGVFHNHQSNRTTLGSIDPCMGIEEALFVPPSATFVVGDSAFPLGTAFRSMGTIAGATNELQQKMEQTWVEQVAQGPYAAYWSTVPSQNLFPTAAVAPAPSSGSTKTSDTVDNTKKRSRVATQPFVAQKPLLAFPAGSVPSESPFTTLKDKNARDWPRLPDPQGKTAPRQICFHCCFPAPYNKCEDPETCSFRNKNQPFLRRKPAKAVLQRFHVDLAESRWRNQEKYPENNWDDLVRFVKSHRDLVAPSAELKALTPSAGWS